MPERERFNVLAIGITMGRDPDTAASLLNAEWALTADLVERPDLLAGMAERMAEQCRTAIGHALAQAYPGYPDSGQSDVHAGNGRV